MSLSLTRGVNTNKFGRRVVFGPSDLFDGTTKIVFTVTGGLVQLNFMTIQSVDDTLNATPSMLNFIANPTLGTTEDLTTPIAIQDSEEGHLWAPRGRTDAALNNGRAVPAQLRPYIVNIGTIECVTTNDSNATTSAQQRIILFYSPVEESGLVVAA